MADLLDKTKSTTLTEDDLGPDDSDVQDTPDGGAIVKLDESPKKGDSEFYTNLAEDIPEPDLNRLGLDLVDLITKDKDARSKRDRQYEEGLRRTGMGEDAPGGATFEGASKVVHPLLTDISIAFASRSIKELWPPDGPAKSKIVGDVTKERVAKAERKADFMNWQLTVQAKEARAEFEQLLTQVPLGGAQYLKLTWNEPRNRPAFCFVAIDDIYLPYAATSFYTTQRKTHVQYITTLEYGQRVASNMYRDVDIVAPSQVPDPTKAAQANDKIEGRDSSAYNEDGLRTVFEVYVTCEIEEDPETDTPAPYIVSIDKSTSKVLSIYRNWDEDDPTQEELEWMVEYPFVPWRGAYPIGLIQMIGGLSAAATGALRALMDSAHIQNSATMLKLKSTGSRGGQSASVNIGEVHEIEGGLNTDDIRKLAMPMPYNPPSQTLFNLMQFVIDAGKGVIATTLDVADANENVPVGTTLARIEQASVVPSAIHARLHNAQQRMLSILHRLNAMYLDDEREKQETGSLIASRADFTGPLDVVPVSDPNIFSEAQRYAQMQMVAQRAQLNPMLYNARNVEERILQTGKIPAWQELLAPKLTPTEENAVSENVKASLGRPIVAFPDQDHIAHLKTHLAYMQSPTLGSSQLMAGAFLPVMIGHLKEHIALWYAQEVFQTANDVTDEDLSDLLSQTKTRPEKQALDRMVAEASLNVVQAADQAFAALPPEIAKAIKLMQQVTPPPPVDPAVQVAREDVQMRGASAAQKAQIEAAKVTDAKQARAEETAREESREQHEDARASALNATTLEAKGVDATQARTDAILDFAAATHAAETDAAAATQVAQSDADATTQAAQHDAAAQVAVAQAQPQPAAPAQGG